MRRFLGLIARFFRIFRRRRLYWESPCMDYQNSFLQTPLSVNEAREIALIAHVKHSIENAKQGLSKLNPKILKIKGMSSCKVRHFLNNLCQLPGSRYMEIGVWKGSTWISALYGNSQSVVEAIAIENWSEFGGPKDTFLHNCRRFLPDVAYNYVCADSFTLNKEPLFSSPINIYFYDGEHTELSQELALTYYTEILDDLFILVVDDWNFEKVQKGTFNALSKLQYKVLFSEALPSSHINDKKNWWNGLFVAVIRK